MAFDVKGLRKGYISCVPGPLAESPPTANSYASCSLPTAECQSTGSTNSKIPEATGYDVSVPISPIAFGTDGYPRWYGSLTKNMCMVVEEWLYTTVQGLEYVDSCHNPSLNAHFHIGRAHPDTWETLFPLAWQGGIHHWDLVDFFSRPGRMAFMWKDTVEYVTPLSKTLTPTSVLCLGLNRQHSSSAYLSHWRGIVLPAFHAAVLGLTQSSSTATRWSLLEHGIILSLFLSDLGSLLVSRYHLAQVIPTHSLCSSSFMSGVASWLSSFFMPGVASSLSSFFLPSMASSLSSSFLPGVACGRHGRLP